MMGCVNACICSGNCLSCGSYKKEEHVGQAEDLYDYLHGYDAEKEAYEKEMKEAYEKEMKEAYEEEYARQEYEMQMIKRQRNEPRFSTLHGTKHCHTIWRATIYRM